MGWSNWSALGLGLGLAEASASLLLGAVAFAQVVPDSTLGEEASTVRSGEVNGLPAEMIEGGAARGTNLFHSFESFNVGAGQRLYFANPAGIANILGRVTGGDVSTINGLLGVDGVANLYLLNPNGIVFGPGAQLDIRGSFTASTAESLVFVDGSVFSAANPTVLSELLTLSVAPGVQYGSQDASITNQGNLAVGQDLTLAAQRLELAGQLEAGRDIVLQGEERQLSNASYTVGGYLFTQDLTGQGVEFVNPHSNVIIANSDVRFDADYSGSSLHVLAEGSISQAEGVNEITVTGGVANSVTQTILNGVGGQQSISVAASDEPILDIRSNVNWQQVRGGLPGNENTSGVAVTFGDGLSPDAASGRGIILENLANSGGNINLAAVNAITTGSLDSSTFFDSGPGGTITIFSHSGDVSTGDVDSSIFSSSRDADSGGAIIIFSHSGDVSTGDVRSSSYNGREGVGGAITISSHFGNITTDKLYSNSFGEEGIGGAITIFSHSGNIVTNNFVHSGADSWYGAGGIGGAITISSHSGDIITNEFLYSGSSSYRGGGIGGAITISSHSGDITINEEVTSYGLSSPFLGGDADSGGAISISSHFGSITINDHLNSGSSSVWDFGDRVGTASLGGAISIYAHSGNITLNGNLSSYSFSNFKDSRSGGFITLAAPLGSIWGENSQLISTSISQGGGIARSGGAVTLIARDTISGLEVVTISSSGDSGSVEIQGLGDLLIQDTRLTTSAQVTFTFPFRAPIVLDTSKFGQAGDTLISSSANLTFDSVEILGSTNGANPAGDVTIASPGLVTFNNSQITTNTNSSGTAGSINIQAPEVVLNDSTSGLFARTNSSGPAGNITLQPYTGGQTLAITLAEDAQIAASTTADITGPGGNVTLQAPQAITLAGNGQIFVGTQGSGPAGSILLQAPTITLQDGVQVSSNARATALPTPNPGGQFTVNVSDLNLVGTGGLFAETEGTAAAGSFLISPHGDGQTLSINLADSAQITASTSEDSTGQGGSVTLSAPQQISLFGNGQISAETQGAGPSGEILLQSPTVTIQDGLRISSNAGTTASPTLETGGRFTVNVSELNLLGTGGLFSETAGAASAGSLTLKPYSSGPELIVSFQNGAQISTNTSGSGAGGGITLSAPERITIQGNGRISSETSGVGSAGNLNITTADLTLQDGATLSVSSSTVATTTNPALAADTTPGNAGNISLNTRSLRLNNQASLQAVTSSGEGGNINLAATEVLALRRNSFISTEARGSGNGGNINVNAGFVVTVPSENNDIIANAFAGSGGQVNLTAQRTLGFMPQSGFTTAQLRSNTSSDLSASSEDGPQGTVAVLNLAIDPSQALAELPVTFSDVTNQIAQGCRVNPATAQSQFVITGRGGLPPSPSDPLASEPSDFPWATRSLGESTASAAEVIPQGETPASPALVEAQGWVREANGDVVFVTASTTVATPVAELLTATACPDPSAP